MTDETKTPTTEADDKALIDLYQHLTRNKANTEAQRKTYFAEKMRAHRAKAREAKASGKLRTTPRFAREALADAAMRVLASNGPGSDAIRAALLEAFPSTPAYVSTIEAQVIKGKLRPKHIPLRLPEPETPAQADADPKVIPMTRPVPPRVPVDDDDEFNPPDFLKRDR